jgi:rubrerythrin
MKIKTKLSQHRRDFEAIYVCEHCGHEDRWGGYDDANFHENVIPNMPCPSCNKTSPKEYTPVPTTYPEGFQV